MAGLEGDPSLSRKGAGGTGHLTRPSEAFEPQLSVRSVAPAARLRRTRLVGVSVAPQGDAACQEHVRWTDAACWSC
jgi:hypothetical protein